MNVTVPSSNIGHCAVIAGMVGSLVEPVTAPPAPAACDPPGALPPFEVPPPLPFATPPPAIDVPPPSPAFVSPLEPQPAAASERAIEASVTVRSAEESLL